MARFELERFVDAAPERVFAVAADFAGAPGRIRAIRELRILTPGPPGPGTRLLQTRRLLGRDSTDEFEVRTFDPPRGYSLACESHGCRIETTFSFRPRDAGTEIRVRFEVTPQTAAAKLLAPLAAPMLASAAVECAEDLDDLEAALAVAQGAGAGG